MQELFGSHWFPWQIASYFFLCYNRAIWFFWRSTFRLKMNNLNLTLYVFKTPSCLTWFSSRWRLRFSSCGSSGCNNGSCFSRFGLGGCDRGAGWGLILVKHLLLLFWFLNELIARLSLQFIVYNLGLLVLSLFSCFTLEIWVIKTGTRII